MDAPELKPVSSRGVSPRVVRLVVAWLAAVLALGLWQAYGAWLLSSVAGHVL
jgi:cytochrome c-type biogenesis protein CcmH/NrfG